MPRYHFSLSQNRILLQSAPNNFINTTVEEIATIDISTVTDVQGGWFIMEADKYHRKDTALKNEGKWILSFRKNDPLLNTTWKKCVSLIFTDKAVHQIKASPATDGFDMQVILIYTKDSLEDRARVFRLLQDNKLDVNPAAPIKYKTQSDTLLDGRNANNDNYTSDTVSHIAEHVPFMEILTKLKNHNYILNRGGNKINGKIYSQSAGEIVKWIELLFSKKIDFNDTDQTRLAQKESIELMLKIEKELATKTKATKGDWFFGFGRREQSTADLYSEVLVIIEHAKTAKTESINYVFGANP